MNKITIPQAELQQTLELLQEGGRVGCETVVFWVGKDNQISEVFRPEQNVRADMFHLPPAAMRNLMAYLRQNRKKILAQIHSHPNEAFHSRADDQWAVIRHQGALSFVLPEFARTTTVDNFMQEVAAFSLSASDQWVQISSDQAIAIQ
ncbi:Mov34/MPN/PAD-1 family protein [Duganella sp. HH101]|uniref:Mov34/MPN/PAD-1 family protein n=1 Tax=Duganella sp. HH101 TaxID=1781066 RepID=UPI000874AFAC|nr:Mov34/MPN/PAD-1 family protein [Duganella sp. HH101]